MLRLVAYDIADPNRLRKVAKVCELYGIRIEKSVFECTLKPELFDKMWAELEQIVDEATDSIIAYKVCQSCTKEIEWLGQISRPEPPALYFVG